MHRCLGSGSHLHVGRELSREVHLSLKNISAKHILVARTEPVRNVVSNANGLECLWRYYSDLVWEVEPTHPPEQKPGWFESPMN